MRDHGDPGKTKRDFAQFARFPREQQRQCQKQIERKIEPHGRLEKWEKLIDRHDRDECWREQRVILQFKVRNTEQQPKAEKQCYFFGDETLRMIRALLGVIHTCHPFISRDPTTRSPARVRLQREISVRQASSSPLMWPGLMRWTKEIRGPRSRSSETSATPWRSGVAEWMRTMPSSE